MSTLDFKDPLPRNQIAGDYVLGTLSAASRREVEKRLPIDAALRNDVYSWQEKLLPLAALAEPVEPSAPLWGRIAGSVQGLVAASITAEPTLPMQPRRDVPSSVPQNRWVNGWESLKLWRGLAGSGFAAAAILAGVLVTRPGAVPMPLTPQYLVVLVAPQDKSPGWVVQASTQDAGRHISLIPLGLDAVPAEKTLQFWTKGDDWSGPVSLGLVQPGQTIKVPLDKLPPLQPNQLFELTLEPSGGSPIGKPTGAIQFIGRAVKVT